MIPATIPAAVVAFQAAVTAAKPLSKAPGLQIAALVAQGNALLVTLDAAIKAAGAPLDGSEPTDPLPGRVDTVRALIQAGDDQRRLHDLRGFVGRAVLNLAAGEV